MLDVMAILSNYLHLGDLWCFLWGSGSALLCIKVREVIRLTPAICCSMMSFKIGEQLFLGYPFPLQPNSLQDTMTMNYKLVELELPLFHL